MYSDVADKPEMVKYSRPTACVLWARCSLVVRVLCSAVLQKGWRWQTPLEVISPTPCSKHRPLEQIGRAEPNLLFCDLNIH